MEFTLDATSLERTRPAATSVVFDRRAALARLDGDEELFAMLVNIFQQDCSRLLDDLHGALKRNDAAAARRSAHSLKGLAANFEATSAVDAALAVERHATDGDLAAAASGFEQLQAHMRLLRDALSA